MIFGGIMDNYSAFRFVKNLYGTFNRNAIAGQGRGD